MSSPLTPHPSPLTTHPSPLRNWTPNQRRAIDTLDRDVCVAAGAGSGKTGVLAERFLKIIKGSVDGKLPEEQRARVDQVLVITFTDKATREMKQRIVNSLTRDGLHNQRRAVETAYISTVHGFCSRLLKENPFESGVDPKFDTIEEKDSLRMLRAAFHETVERGFVDDDDDIVELVSAAQNERVFGVDVGDPLAALESSVRSILARIRGAGIRLDDLRSRASEQQEGSSARSLLLSWLNPAAGELQSTRDRIAAVTGLLGFIEQKRRALLEALEGVQTLPEDADWSQIATLAAALKSVDAAAARASSSWRSRSGNPREEELLTEVLRIRELTEPYKTIFAIEAVRERSADTLSRRLIHLAIRTWEVYEREKRKLGSVDSDDLQAEAAHLLHSAPAVLQRCRRQFRYLMVDEFQDIDPIQMQIIGMLSPLNTNAPLSQNRNSPLNTDPHLSQNCESPLSTDLPLSQNYENPLSTDLPLSQNWERGPGGEGPNLFIVGDTQQSIYGFRNADCKIFQGIARNFDQDGLIPLSENFRSRPEIIAFVNRLFGQAWGSSGVAFEPLIAAAKHDPRPGPSIEALVVRDPGWSYPEVEAAALAERIAQMVESRELMITDKSHDDFGQPVEYRHIAVLLRAITDIEAYEKAFARRGVPMFVVGGGRGYYARREIRDVINILSLIDCPLDDVALVATLRSPMVGLEMDTIYRLARLDCSPDGVPPNDPTTQRPNDPLYLRIEKFLDEASISLVEADRLRALHTLIEKHRRVQDVLPVAHLLERVVADTQYDARLLVRPNGRRRLANLRKLIQMAGAEQGHGVAGFISRLKEIERVSEREGDAPTEEENANVVRFLTIHKAKGLEFPVVFLGDMARPLHFDRKETFNCDPQTLTIGCRLGEYQSAAYRAIAAARLRREEEESIRILYVALTRAREYLALCGSTPNRNRKPNWADQIFPILGIAGEPAGTELKTIAPDVTMLLRSMKEFTTA